MLASAAQPDNAVIPGRREASSYDVHSHIIESISHLVQRPHGFSDVRLHIRARAYARPGM